MCDPQKPVHVLLRIIILDHLLFRRLMLFQFFPVGGAVRCFILYFPICQVDINGLRIVYDMPLQFPVLCYAFFQFLDPPAQPVPHSP